jgi:hypothetical protein
MPVPVPVPGVHGPMPGIIVWQGIGVPLPGIIDGQGIGVPLPGIIDGQGIGVPMPGVPCAPVAPEEVDPRATPRALAVAPLHVTNRTASIPSRPRGVQCCLRRRILLTAFGASFLGGNPPRGRIAR